MYYVIHAKRVVLLMIVLVLIGVTFWVGFYGSDELRQAAGDYYASDNEDAAEVEQDAEPAVDVFSSQLRTVSELDDGMFISVTSVPTKFVEYRIEREKVRSQRLDLLERMLETAELDPDNRNKLQLELVGLLDNIARETELENLLKMNGYLDAVVFIENDSATIVVPVTLSSYEAEAIGEMVRRITNIRLDRITIIDELTNS